MCGSHTYGKVGKETRISEVQPTPTIGGVKQLTGGEIGKNIQNNYILDSYLKNPSQRTHFEKLHNGQEKLKYINRLIVESYADSIAQAYQEGKISYAQELEKAMTTAMATASQIIFGNTTNSKA